MKTNMLAQKVVGVLIIFGLSVFGLLLAPHVVFAESKTAVLCVSPDYTTVVRSTNNVCVNPRIIVNIPYDDAEEKVDYVCVDRPSKSIIPTQLTPDGNYICSLGTKTLVGPPDSTKSPPVLPGPGGTPPTTTPPSGGGGGTGTGSGGSGGVTCPAGTSTTNGGVVCLPDSPYGNSTTGLVGVKSVSGLIKLVIDTLLYFAGILAAIYIIIGGYFYLTAAGDTKQAERGKSTLTTALIGLAIVLLSFALVTFVTSLVKGP